MIEHQLYYHSILFKSVDIQLFQTRWLTNGAVDMMDLATHMSWSHIWVSKLCYLWDEGI